MTLTHRYGLFSTFPFTLLLCLYTQGLSFGDGLAEANASCYRNPSEAQAHHIKPPARIVNSTPEDALVLDATLEALLKFPAIRAKLPEESHASKIIFNVSGFSNVLIHVFGKNNRHPAAVFMDDQFEKQVPENVLNDLDRRNAGATSWNKYKPGIPNIITMSNDEIIKTYDDDPFAGTSDWYKRNPDFVGDIATLLPGYSRRRSMAVVRFSYRPVPHMCMGSCLLVKEQRKWTVQRIEITDMP